MTADNEVADPMPDAGTPSRAVARMVGVLFIAAMLTYGPGSGITTSFLDAPDYLTNVAANPTVFALGAVLMLVNCLVAAAIGVLVFPILRRHSERIAVGYAACRLTEAVLLTVGVVSLLTLTALGEHYVDAGATGPHFETLGTLAIRVNHLSYQIGMAALGVGSLFFCYLLHRTRLVPGLLALWGFVGYAVFLAGALLELFGVEVGLLLSIPGGLFEVAFGLWLMFKGFRPPPAVPPTRRPARPLVDADAGATR